MERFLDFLFSFFAILFLIPILVPVCLALRLSGEGEIFYLQERVGKKGKIFKLIKFATMLKDSPNIGAGEITLKNDPRILPLGEFLRKTKINELPQLINIIKGDMSIIGPRPMVPNTYKKYSYEAQESINLIRPGLSGIGSIIFRDEEKFLQNREDSQIFYDNEIIPYKSALETWYVGNKSISNYFKCIFLTIWVIIFPKSDLVTKIFKNLPERPDTLNPRLLDD